MNPTAEQSLKVVLSIVIVSFLILYFVKYVMDESVKAEKETGARFDWVEYVFNLTSIAVLRIIAWTYLVLSLAAALAAFFWLPSQTIVFLGSQPDSIKHYGNVYIALSIALSSVVLPVFLLVVARTAENIQYMRDRWPYPLTPPETIPRLEIKLPPDDTGSRP